MSKKSSFSVLGTPLELCSCEPMTGWFRNGFCETDKDDRGSHVVCAEMTDEFLAYTRRRGNDLSTPRPEFGFPGLEAGDHWCLCAIRWAEAVEAGVAPPVFLERTERSALEVVDLDTLKRHAVLH
ncbi:MAG: DUF2237 family protein [Bradymonadia bacterium]